MPTRTSLLVLAVWGLAACGPRDPGPHENERGEVTYWRVTATDIAFEDCTDAPAFRDDLDAPEFEPNSFLMYRVSDDGQEAVVQTCDTTRAESCTDSDTGIVFDVDGHELVHDPAPVVEALANSECQLQGDELWLLEDKGETVDLTIDFAFSLLGETAACQQIDTQAKADAPNGAGLEGCVVTILIDGEWYGSAAP